ncbi:MAG TPA: EamA family transporter [Edaphobacter sp.]|jgi:drug/metabolite transporter (DMT)-like permease|nr:EamA family transporter [Edaphobacter sp.]
MQHTLTPRRWLVLLAVMLGASIGDALLGIGMKQIGPVSLAHLSTLFFALKSPWIISGIVVLLGFMASYMTALSWADITFVLPATAFGNVIVTLLSKFWLNEHVSASRWLGIALIVIGVGFVANGPSRTEHPQAEPVPEVVP